MKYIIKNSDLFLNGKLIREGSEIELSEEQTKGIEDFLIPLTIQSHSALDAESDSKSHPEPVVGSANEKETKSKSKGNKK